MKASLANTIFYFFKYLFISNVTAASIHIVIEHIFVIHLIHCVSASFLCVYIILQPNYYTVNLSVMIIVRFST